MSTDLHTNLLYLVLSSSVAHALEYYKDDNTMETRTFVKMFVVHAHNIHT